MPRHMRWMIEFAIVLIMIPVGYGYGAEQRKVADRLDPLGWIIDAPTRLAIGPLVTGIEVHVEFKTLSSCDLTVRHEFEKFPGAVFRPRCIPENGVRSIWKVKHEN